MPRSATPKPKPRAKARAIASWTVADAVAVIAVWFALFLGKDAVLSTAAVQRLSVEGALFARIGVLVGYYAAQVAVLAWFADRRGSTLPDAFRLRLRVEPASAMRATGLVVAMLLATRAFALVYGVIGRAFGFVSPGGDVVVTVFGTGPIGIALAVVLVAGIGPFVEEIAFRGVVLDGIRERFGTHAAIVGSALLFALFHFDAWMFIPMAVLGLALGWLAVRHKTLWPAIAVHALYNAFALAAAFLVASR